MGNPTLFHQNFSELLNKPKGAGERTIPFQVRGKDIFLKNPLPETRSEPWRNLPAGPFYDFQPVNEFQKPAIPRDLFNHPLWPQSGCVLVFLNGRLETGVSRGVLGTGNRVRLSTLGRDPGIISEDIFPEQENQGPFSNLNLALLKDFIYLDIPEETDLPDPIHIVWIHTSLEGGHHFHPRIKISIGKNSKARLNEIYFGNSNQTYLVNSQSDFNLDDSSHLHYSRIQVEGPKGVLLHQGNFNLQAQALVNFQNYEFGGGWEKNQFQFNLEGKKSECHLTGLTLFEGQQGGDLQISINHKAPNTRSEQNFKTILSDSARSVFTGKVTISTGASGSEAHQSCKNLILSETARAMSQPQLEIYEDDVKCTHGATTGHLDPEALFYLRARGIGLEDSRRILLEAFAAEALSRLCLEGLRVKLSEFIQEKIQRIGL